MDSVQGVFKVECELNSAVERRKDRSARGRGGRIVRATQRKDQGTRGLLLHTDGRLVCEHKVHVHGAEAAER